jgi:3'-5' exoribonuclease
MGRTKPRILKLHELEPGQQGDFFALLGERNRGATRENKPFYVCRFRDSHRTATMMVWQDSDWFDPCEKEWHVGMFFKLRATYVEHPQYGPQIDVLNLRPVADSDRADGFNETDFLERSRFNSDEMFDELRSLAEKELRDEPLKKLTLLILDAHADKLKRLPATPRNHYPFPGGWLEHTLSVTKNCLWLAEKYRDHYRDLKPPLNRDLVLGGAILHEIGRVFELDDPREPGAASDVTVAGKLLGHVSLGRDLIRDAARVVEGLDPEFMQLLDHLILSHPTPPEWGSPRVPVIPEVILLHHADELDAQFEMYARCLRRDASSGPFTDRDPILGRRLLKERKQ